MSHTGPPSAGATSGASFAPQPAVASATPGPTAPTHAVPTTTTPVTTSTTAIPPPVVPPPSNPQNLNQIVTDYLLKKGYKRTEEIFRQEVKDLDESGRPRQHSDAPISDKIFPAGKYLSSFKHFERWVDNGLDLYKFELGKVMWPLFVYSYLRLVAQGSTAHAKEFMQKCRRRFETARIDELRGLEVITLAPHVQENSMAKIYRENRYVIPINKSLTGNLFHFLERELDQCGAVVLDIIQQHCRVDSVDRGPIEPFSFEAIYRRARNQELDDVDIQEGIPGLASHSGVANRDILENQAALRLGPLPLDGELRDDVAAELEEEDRLHPPKDGIPTLVDEFNSMHPIKKEAGDSPQRTDIPYPPSRARDVVVEMQKVRENRDRFRIEGRTGGVGPGLSVCMFTFHNHLGSFSCIDFSKDQELVAVGTTESYIRVWSLDGKSLKSSLPPEKDMKVNNRKLIGHSAPVYSVAFSDAISNIDRNLYEGEQKPETDSKLLLSCSADGQVRLWSLDIWACLCIYKGHDGPVTSLSWSPHGHYFVTGGWDKTVRIWAQDHASAIRLLVGHDTPVSTVAWHPNGTYVFSSSDETDKSIRMWAMARGECVRVFTGHTDYISALECAPNGKILASADIGGNIFLWDIEKATRIKRCRGHGRGGIWSLSFSVESTVLVSGGQDSTVRVWDVEMPAEGSRPANQQDSDGTIVAAGTQGESKQAGTATQPTSNPGTGKKKGKEVMVTPDQISAFPTKKTPVLKVQCTRMNLVLAGGCYYPETQDRDR
ncbi:WD domain-containing protein [Ustulina deusta]|nr:WD domain-containing protein [Ustulina deusta]KAI3335121.1 WD domain-containing protein [Ustulina deusta]